MDKLIENEKELGTERNIGLNTVKEDAYGYDGDVVDDNP